MKGLSNIGVIILAAGSSGRLGQPKQLVQFRGKSLLQHTIDATESFDFATKNLILGANAKEILTLATLKGFDVVTNHAWSDGIASSIQIGIKQTIGNPEIDHLLFLLSDQPFLSEELIENILSIQSEHKEITACEYANCIGVPAMFSKKYFQELKSLKGDQGAKPVIQKHLSKVKTVTFEMGGFDIDTLADLEELKTLNQQKT